MIYCASFILCLVEQAGELLPRLIQLMNAKGRERVDHPAVVSCGATDGYRHAGPTVSQNVGKRRDVLTHMSSLAEKDRDDQQRVAAASYQLFARQQQIGRHQLQKCESDSDLGALRADALDQLIKGLPPARIARTMGEQNQASAHQDAYAEESPKIGDCPALYQFILNKSLFIPLRPKEAPLYSKS